MPVQAQGLLLPRSRDVSLGLTGCVNEGKKQTPEHRRLLLGTLDSHEKLAKLGNLRHSSVQTGGLGGLKILTAADFPGHI